MNGTQDRFLLIPFGPLRTKTSPNEAQNTLAEHGSPRQHVYLRCPNKKSNTEDGHDAKQGCKKTLGGNTGPKSSILIGFPWKKPSIFWVPLFLETPISKLLNVLLLETVLNASVVHIVERHLVQIDRNMLHKRQFRTMTMTEKEQLPQGKLIILYTNYLIKIRISWEPKGEINRYKINENQGVFLHPKNHLKQQVNLQVGTQNGKKSILKFSPIQEPISKLRFSQSEKPLRVSHQIIQETHRTSHVQDWRLWTNQLPRCFFKFSMFNLGFWCGKEKENEKYNDGTVDIQFWGKLNWICEKSPM